MTELQVGGKARTRAGLVVAVRAECLDEAVTLHPETTSHGIWAGMDGPQIAAERRPRGLAPALPPIEHGTTRGYRGHLARGEKACEDCSKANNKASFESRARARTA